MEGGTGRGKKRGESGRRCEGQGDKRGKWGKVGEGREQGEEGKRKSVVLDAIFIAVDVGICCSVGGSGNGCVAVVVVVVVVLLAAVIYLEL